MLKCDLRQTNDDLGRAICTHAPSKPMKVRGYSRRASSRQDAGVPDENCPGAARGDSYVSLSSEKVLLGRQVKSADKGQCGAARIDSRWLKMLLAMILALAMLFFLCACGSQDVLGAAEDILGSVEDVLGAQDKDLSDDTQESADSVGKNMDEPDISGYDTADDNDAEGISEDGAYTTKEDVALYIHTYGRLPGNFITKKEAEDLGWTGGSLEPYAPGACIGGSRFGNYEGLLPEAEGRVYRECDINTLGADKRGAERIVYSNDGLIYYTGDHYESFELLYGEE